MGPAGSVRVTGEQQVARGLLGAVTGALYFGGGSLFGHLAGTVGGVFVGEHLRRRRRARLPSAESARRVGSVKGGRGDWRTARAAGGTLVGYLFGAVAQVVLGLLSVIIFVIALLY